MPSACFVRLFLFIQPSGNRISNFLAGKQLKRVVASTQHREQNIWDQKHLGEKNPPPKTRGKNKSHLWKKQIYLIKMASKSCSCPSIDFVVQKFQITRELSIKNIPKWKLIFNVYSGHSFNNDI